ncbi:hypothetical protein [Streptomyces silvensis]|uniref:Uncharacterized protein n=1 Tax=Streptomyces silvensis TaxID=1765722 RepID=A0A0W7X311_9ACTN|nr:hypothetical protein [Streptomyces silvensis]KUF17244.1 hypothetical protein AT728_15550 [Streptomyces silvensis]
MNTTDQDESRAAELYRIYRAHLETCPRRHVGILADCAAGTGLGRAVRNARRSADGGPARCGT